MFQSVSGHSSEQSKAHGQLYRSWKVPPYPTLYQTDLRITDHRGYKFSPSLTLLSVQNSNRMDSRLTAIASFPSLIFHFLQYSRQHPSTSARWAALMTKIDSTYPAFPLRFAYFAAQYSAFVVSFHSTPSDARVRFDSAVIFLDQSQFLASHCNQWDCFIL